MKIVPKTVSKEQQAFADEKVKKVTGKAALIIAFASVFVFFFKLLFF